MKTTKTDFPSLVQEILRRRKLLLSQLAHDLGMSHATVIRWLSGADIPSPRSCRKLADYAGVPLNKIMAAAGHIPAITPRAPDEWPEFREYANHKYPELDEDLVCSGRPD